MNLRPLQQGNQLLSRLDDAELDFFESVSEEVHVDAGTILLEEESPADTFYVVLKGKVALEMTSPGRQPMVMQTLGRGDMVGVSWPFPPHRWNWQARAMVDTDLIAFDAAAIRARCDQDPSLAVDVLSVVGEEVTRRLNRARIQLLDLYEKD
ncbi:MAG: cyclic nucleotide-binding domain-containing protein [Acidimicrobiia bacterium]